MKTCRFFFRVRSVLSMTFIAGVFFAAFAQKIITIQADKPGIAISPTLYGIFFEDINWAADGGLYGEMVQNRSFEYVNVFGSQFTSLTSWTLIRRGGAIASMTVSTSSPLYADNPHYVELKIDNGGTGAGIVNGGFGGIAVMSGESYIASLWVRRISGSAIPVKLSLEKPDGTILGSATIDNATTDWAFYTATIKVDKSEIDARFVVSAAATGSLALDMISLFPQKTFNNRPNGLRADLVQRLIGMKPKFIRFPGGCIVHSNNLATAYRWKNTIGPVERRIYTPNRWGYMQSGGLGFYEFFQLCEDIGSIPIPIVPCGVSCHFKTPYQVVPIVELQPWIDDALDLIEYANGPATSTWGAKRAAAGHPEPFNLEYIGIGNEEWGPEFKERSTLFVKAVRAKYPAIKIVGTSGPSASGTDFTDLWAYNRTQKSEVVDEHYYQPTSWFLANTHRYDNYNRKDPLVFAGEYASRTPVQKTLSNAVAEAAFMTGLERNGDLVRLSSYAPLFCHVNCNGSPAEGPWNPDLIYFDHYRTYVTPSYHVQALFANNVGHRLLQTTISSGSDGPLYAVTSLDTLTGDILLKVVNSGSGVERCTLQVKGVSSLNPTGTLTVLTSGKSDGANSFAQPDNVVPVESELTGVSTSFVRSFPGNSVSVLRMKTKSTFAPQKPVEHGDRLRCVSIGSDGGSQVFVRLLLEQGGNCTMRCISPQGRVIATIIDRYMSVGSHTIRWTGIDKGTSIAAGTYLIEISFGKNYRTVHHIVVVR